MKLQIVLLGKKSDNEDNTMALQYL